MRLQVDPHQQRITLGNTAEFELTVDETDDFPGPNDFQVTSDNQRFVQRWVQVVTSTGAEEPGARKYTLQVRPSSVDVRAFGNYALTARVRPQGDAGPTTTTTGATTTTSTTGANNQLQ